MKHPRFLGFLWEHHAFRRMEEKPCTLKCRHCDKVKHRPCFSDIVDLGEKIVARPTIYFIDSYQYRECKVCGRVERRFVRLGVQTGRSCGKWKEVKNENGG